jgi:four helix bundle protein
MPKTFEDLDAFQQAVALAVAIYRATSAFPTDERYGLTAQLRRASTSVASNIAEGQGRLTNGEWRQFLSHARGSLYEIQAQLIVAEKLELLGPSAHRTLRSAVTKAAKPLAGLIDYVRRREKQTTDN